MRGAHGALPADGMKTALLLPMGRKGPAFLAYENFQVLQGWNNSMVYVTTVAYFGTRLAGAPPVGRGDQDIEVMQPQDVMELQRFLIKMGNDIGDVDGKVGAKTRSAIKQAQIKVGLPADSIRPPSCSSACARPRAAEPSASFRAIERCRRITSPARYCAQSRAKTAVHRKNSSRSDANMNRQPSSITTV